jgi:hypothetical protein
MTNARWRRCLALTALLLAAAPGLPAHAQPAGEALVDVDADPIRCWWRADRGAIRIGEPLTLTLTCALVDTAAARVVVDRQRLDPSVVTMPPFDVTGGTQAADTVTGSRRFFQYTYVLNVIHENAIGRDLLVPELAISYRIESRVDGASSIEGRDRTYQLPALPLRLVSLVAVDAQDIREAEQGAFAAIAARELRGRLLRLAAAGCFVLAALLVIVAIRRARAGAGQMADAPGRVTDRALITGAAAVLADARAALGTDPRDETAAGRALDALRVIGAYAVGRGTNQTVVGRAAHEAPGQLRLRGGWLGGRHALISASTTAADVRRQMAAMPPGSESRRLKLEGLATALSHLTARRYGAPSADQDSELDAALGESLSLAEDLAREHLWVQQQRRAGMERLTSFGARVWTR